MPADPRDEPPEAAQDTAERELTDDELAEIDGGYVPVNKNLPSPFDPPEIRP